MENWYVRNTSGKTFGPIDAETLAGWVREGRVEPLAGVSRDLKNWMLAPLKPELEMDCIVENNPGQFYGPTHREVAASLAASGSLAAGARFYRDEKILEREADALRAEIAARDARIAELEAEMERRAAEAAELEAENGRRGEEIAGLKAEIERRDAVHAREWSTEVLVPDVIEADEPPPPVAGRAFAATGAAALADLERRAQEELARMGAGNARKFFRMGK